MSEVPIRNFPVPENLKAFVNDILVLENPDNASSHHLPFYADGFPGIMFGENEHGITLQPYKKLLPPFFLYGQTIEPIALEMKGSYKIIVFQIYPFATRLFLGINPKEINDACYDLAEVQDMNHRAVVQSLQDASKLEERIDLISTYITKLAKHSSTDIDKSIKMAISILLNTKGKISIAELREQLHISERTFERRFSAGIGVSPKQFARIVQFNFSLNQLKEEDYLPLTNVAFDNGFADQSHFIRTFKKYTGRTPGDFQKEL